MLGMSALRLRGGCQRLLTLLRGLHSLFFVELVRFNSGRAVEPHKLLAEGGFSFVYAARDTRSGQRVALKKMICQDEEARAAATREAETHQRFSHENILPLLDSAFRPHPENRHWEVCWLVFPLCQCSLRDEITRQVLDLPTAKPVGQLWTNADILRHMIGVASGLQTMHRQGVAHRDLKPENVLLKVSESGAKPLLMDFGSCGPTEVQIAGRRDALRETEAAASLCTMQYRSPELFDVPSQIGRLSYAACDVWSLGCTLYCCLHGYSPFEVEFSSREPFLPRQVESGHLRVMGAVPWPKAGPRVTPFWMQELVTSILVVNGRPDLSCVIARMETLVSDDSGACASHRGLNP